MCTFSLVNNLLFLIFLLQSYGKKRQVPSFFLVFRLAICDSILVLRQTPIANRFSVAEKVLPFDNSNKKLDFCFVLCSLIRTFETASRKYCRSTIKTKK